MDLKIEGRVVEVLEEQTGEGRNGPWRKREFILETEEQYPAKICMVQWGDEIDRSVVAEGERLTAHIDIRSREYNGRWYTDVKAWRVQKAAAAGADERAAGPGAPGTPPDEFGVPTDDVGAPSNDYSEPLDDTDMPF